MVTKEVLLIILALPIIALSSCGGVESSGIMPEEGIKILTIIVIYDNNPYKEGLETAWGFSCLVRGAEKTVLFDTGGDGSILLANMKRLGIDPKEVEVVVLSHIHGDHVGGLSSFLSENHDVTVYLPKSFPQSFKDGVKRYGAEPVEVYDPLKICEQVYSTGELGVGIREQSLVIHTEGGLAVITGCAHPGIVSIVEKAKDLVKAEVLFVMGGFHLGSKSEGEIEQIIASFKQLGVRYAGPCHCSGDRARQLFEEAYGKNFLRIGVGETITISEDHISGN